MKTEFWTLAGTKMGCESVVCTRVELKQALKFLQENHFKTARISLKVDGVQLYIYTSDFSGRKNVLKEYTNKQDDLDSMLGKSQIQNFNKLYSKIIKLI